MKPTASPLQVARSRQAHGFSIKKKKNTENRNRTHHVAGACKNPITSLAWQRSNPITQYKSKPKSELSKLSTLTQRTEHRGVYQKKKKIPNTQTKTKPSNPRSPSPSSSLQRAPRRRRRNGGPHRRSTSHRHRRRRRSLYRLPSAPLPLRR